MHIRRNTLLFSISLLVALPVSAASIITDVPTDPLTPSKSVPTKTLPPTPATTPAPQKTTSSSNVAVPATNPGGLGGSPASGGLGGSPASGGTSGSGGGLVNPLNSISSLPELLRAILGGVVQIGAIFLTVMIVYVGFLFVAARGNEEKISSARSALLWTIIGGLILLGASAIELVIEATVKTL